MQGEMDKSAFWKYKKISLAQTRNQQLDPSMVVPSGTNYSCIITTMWASKQSLASEPAFVMHALRKGFKVESMSSVEPGLFSTRRQGLMFWRHEQSLDLWRKRLKSGDNEMHEDQQAADESSESPVSDAEDDARRIEAAYAAVGMDVLNGEDPFALAEQVRNATEEDPPMTPLSEDNLRGDSTPEPPAGDAAEDDPFVLAERLYSPRKTKAERLEESRLRRLARREARKVALQQKM